MNGFTQDIISTLIGVMVGGWLTLQINSKSIRKTIESEMRLKTFNSLEPLLKEVKKTTREMILEIENTQPEESWSYELECDKFREILRIIENEILLSKEILYDFEIITRKADYIYEKSIEAKSKIDSIAREIPAEFYDQVLELNEISDIKRELEGKLSLLEYNIETFVIQFKQFIVNGMYKESYIERCKRKWRRILIKISMAIYTHINRKDLLR